MKPSRCVCRGECGIDHEIEGAPAWWARENLGDGKRFPCTPGERCAATEGHDHPVTGSANVKLRAFGGRQMCHRCIARIDGPRRARKAAETRRLRRLGPKLPGAYWDPPEGEGSAAVGVTEERS